MTVLKIDSLMENRVVRKALDQYLHPNFDLTRHVKKIVSEPEFQDRIETISEALINHSILTGEDIKQILIADAGVGQSVATV